MRRLPGQAGGPPGAAAHWPGGEWQDHRVAQRTETDWVDRFADEVVAEAQRRAPDRPIVCASGLSPSGPIHLGNLREVMTPHLVADEIRRRGHDCVHILSWDDYDRFRK